MVKNRKKVLDMFNSFGKLTVEEFNHLRNAPP